MQPSSHQHRSSASMGWRRWFLSYGLSLCMILVLLLTPIPVTLGAKSTNTKSNSCKKSPTAGKSQPSSSASTATSSSRSATTAKKSTTSTTTDSTTRGTYTGTYTTTDRVHNKQQPTPAATTSSSKTNNTATTRTTTKSTTTAAATSNSTKKSNSSSSIDTASTPDPYQHPPHVHCHLAITIQPQIPRELLPLWPGPHNGPYQYNSVIPPHLVPVEQRQAFNQSMNWGNSFTFSLYATYQSACKIPQPEQILSVYSIKTQDPRVIVHNLRLPDPTSTSERHVRLNSRNSSNTNSSATVTTNSHFWQFNSSKIIVPAYNPKNPDYRQFFLVNVTLLGYPFDRFSPYDVVNDTLNNTQHDLVTRQLIETNYMYGLDKMLTSGERASTKYWQPYPKNKRLYPDEVAAALKDIHHACKIWSNMTQYNFHLVDSVISFEFSLSGPRPFRLPPFPLTLPKITKLSSDLLNFGIVTNDAITNLTYQYLYDAPLSAIVNATTNKSGQRNSTNHGFVSRMIQVHNPSNIHPITIFLAPPLPLGNYSLVLQSNRSARLASISHGGELDPSQWYSNNETYALQKMRPFPWSLAYTSKHFKNFITLQPNSKGELGPIDFYPQTAGNFTAMLPLFNNLTRLSFIRLKGEGRPEMWSSIRAPNSLSFIISPARPRDYPWLPTPRVTQPNNKRVMYSPPEFLLNLTSKFSVLPGEKANLVEDRLRVTNVSMLIQIYNRNQVPINITRLVWTTKSTWLHPNHSLPNACDKRPTDVWPFQLIGCPQATRWNLDIVPLTLKPNELTHFRLVYYPSLFLIPPNDTSLVVDHTYGRSRIPVIVELPPGMMGLMLHTKKLLDATRANATTSNHTISNNSTAPVTATATVNATTTTTKTTTTSNHTPPSNDNTKIKPSTTTTPASSSTTKVGTKSSTTASTSSTVPPSPPPSTTASTSPTTSASLPKSVEPTESALTFYVLVVMLAFIGGLSFLYLRQKPTPPPAAPIKKEVPVDSNGNVPSASPSASSSMKKKHKKNQAKKSHASASSLSSSSISHDQGDDASESHPHIGDGTLTISEAVGGSSELDESKEIGEDIVETVAAEATPLDSDEDNGTGLHVRFASSEQPSEAMLKRLAKKAAKKEAKKAASSVNETLNSLHSRSDLTPAALNSLGQLYRSTESTASTATVAASVSTTTVTTTTSADPATSTDSNEDTVAWPSVVATPPVDDRSLRRKKPSVSAVVDAASTPIWKSSTPAANSTTVAASATAPTATTITPATVIPAPTKPTAATPTTPVVDVIKPRVVRAPKSTATAAPSVTSTQNKSKVEKKPPQQQVKTQPPPPPSIPKPVEPEPEGDWEEVKSEPEQIEGAQSDLPNPDVSPTGSEILQPGLLVEGIINPILSPTIFSGGFFDSASDGSAVGSSRSATISRQPLPSVGVIGGGNGGMRTSGGGTPESAVVVGPPSASAVDRFSPPESQAVYGSLFSFGAPQPPLAVGSIGAIGTSSNSSLMSNSLPLPPPSVNSQFVQWQDDDLSLPNAADYDGFMDEYDAQHNSQNNSNNPNRLLSIQELHNITAAVQGYQPAQPSSISPTLLPQHHLIPGVASASSSGVVTQMDAQGLVNEFMRRNQISSSLPSTPPNGLANPGAPVLQAQTSSPSHGTGGSTFSLHPRPPLHISSGSNVSRHLHQVSTGGMLQHQSPSPPSQTTNTQQWTSSQLQPGSSNSFLGPNMFQQVGHLPGTGSNTPNPAFSSGGSSPLKPLSPMTHLTPFTNAFDLPGSQRMNPNLYSGTGGTPPGQRTPDQQPPTSSAMRTSQLLSPSHQSQYLSYQTPTSSGGILRNTPPNSYVNPNPPAHYVSPSAASSGSGPTTSNIRSLSPDLALLLSSRYPGLKPEDIELLLSQANEDRQQKTAQAHSVLLSQQQQLVAQQQQQQQQRASAEGSSLGTPYLLPTPPHLGSSSPNSLHAGPPGGPRNV